MKKYQGFLIFLLLFSYSFLFAKEKKRLAIDQKVQKLILQLKYSQYENDREDAAMRLGDLGIHAKKSIPPLLKALQFDQYGTVRYESGIALSRISKNTFLAVAHGAQNDSDESVRKVLTKHLPKYGKVAIPILIKILTQEKNSELQAEAVRALGTFKEKAISAMPYFIKILDRKDEFLRFRLFTAIKKIGIKGLPFLIQGLKKQKKDLVRIRSAWLIGKMGSKAFSAVPDLIQALRDKNHYVKQNSAYALKKIGLKSFPAVPNLIQLLYHENDMVKIHALGALEAIGSKSAPSITILIRMLQHKNKEIQSSSADALGGIGNKSAKAIPVLIKLLKNPEDHIRYSVIKALGKIKCKPNMVIKALIPLLKDKVNYIKVESIQTIAIFGKKSIKWIPEILEIVKKETNQRVKKKMLRSIEKIKL